MKYFIDTSNVIVPITDVGTKETTYNATEDCYIYAETATHNGGGSSVKINGVQVDTQYVTSGTLTRTSMFLLKKGDVVTLYANYKTKYAVYGVR